MNSAEADSSASAAGQKSADETIRTFQAAIDKDKADLEPVFARVSDDLRTQYVIGYYAPSKGKDASFRTVKVRMKDPMLRDKFDLRHRSGYYADAR